MLTTINLYGKLGQLFGTQFKLQIANTAEAIRALASVLDGFAQYLNTSASHGIAYQVLVDEVEIDETHINYPIRNSLTICPVIAGSGSATTRIITGAVLLGVSFFMPAAFMGISSQAIGYYGAAMAIGGVLQLLTPEKVDENSFLSDGSQVQRAFQGSAVPVLFGERVISPIPISVWVDNETIQVDFNPN